MKLTLSIAGGIVLGTVALLIIIGALRSHAPIKCPTYADWSDPLGQPIAGRSEALWARGVFGDRVVDHCWPGSPKS